MLPKLVIQKLCYTKSWHNGIHIRLHSPKDRYVCWISISPNHLQLFACHRMGKSYGIYVPYNNPLWQWKYNRKQTRAWKS